MASAVLLPHGVSTLTLRLLGPFEARLGEEPLPRLRSRKGPWLIALLALRHGCEVERSWLAGTLWPDSSEQDAYASLRKSLFDLRSALGPQAVRLQSPTSHSLLLDLVGASVDLLEFDAAIRYGDPTALERAVSLYRGPLLEGCDQEWVLAERQAREAAYLEALERLAAAAAADGDLAGAVGCLRQVVVADPLRESAHRALMQALAESGSEAAATLVYRDLRRLLHRELNAEPAAETAALYQQLRAEAREKASRRSFSPLQPGAAPPTRLPFPLTALIGRQQEVCDVAARLAGSRLVTLTGAGGVGKTRLGIEVATVLAGGFPDGVFFVDLASLREPALVPPAVAGELDVREEPGQPAEARLIDFLGARCVLLVLDNCEHLVSSCARQVEALLRSCPHLHVLTTSRQPLGITGEVVWRVPSLGVPPEQAGNPAQDDSRTPRLDQYPSVQLFIERARAAQPSFELTRHNAPAIAQVCRRLDGIPLAIELAAARLPFLSVEQIAARLDDRLGLLTSGSRTALPRQRTLRATLDWSYELLSEREQVLFRRLSIFAGAFSLEAVEAVCAEGAGIQVLGSPSNKRSLNTRIPGYLNTRGILDLLGAMVEKSLVSVVAAHACLPGEPRYRLLETTLEYAGALRKQAGEDGALRRAHARYFTLFAEEAAALVLGPNLVNGLKRLAGAHDNLRAALDWCTGPGACEDSELGLRLVTALEEFWYQRGDWTEGRRWIERALSAGSTLSPAGASALLGASKLARAQQDLAAGRSLAEASLAIYEELEQPAGMARALSHLAWAVRGQGDRRLAACQHERSLRIRQQLGDRTGTAGSLNNLGVVAFELGDYAQSRAFHRQAAEIFRELGSLTGVGEALGGLGDTARAEGVGDEAEASYREALALFHEVGHKIRIRWMLEGLAGLAAGRGEEGARRAARLFGAAETLGESLTPGAVTRIGERYGPALDAARAALGEEAFSAASAEGREMTLEEAVAEALAPAAR